MKLGKKYKFFACSDIHSAYTPWMEALNKAGFDEKDDTHIIVLCGDAFDRKDESMEVLRFIMRMIKENKIILVKGNHDLLLEECCDRGFPYSHDKHNGTVKTIQDIGGFDKNKDFLKCCESTWNKTGRYREMLINYFETKNHIFVHSWIPIFNAMTGGRYQHDKVFSWREDWRNATEYEWEDAMWLNSFDMAEQGLNKTGKTIVFGHFHTSYQWAKDGKCSEFGEDAIFESYYGENYIGLDRCVAYTNKINIAVIEDEIDEDWFERYGNKYDL